MLGKMKSHIGMITWKTCICKETRKPALLRKIVGTASIWEGRSVCPLCLARRGLGAWGSQEGGRRAWGPGGPGPGQPRRQGGEVAAWNHSQT